MGFTMAGLVVNTVTLKNVASVIGVVASGTLPFVRARAYHNTLTSSFQNTVRLTCWHLACLARLLRFIYAVQVKQLTEDVATCSPSAQQIAVFKASFDHYSDGDDAGSSTSPACVYNLTVRELLDM